MGKHTGHSPAGTGPWQLAQALASTHQDIRDRYLVAQARAEEALERARVVVAKAEESIRRARATRAAANDAWQHAGIALSLRDEIDGTDRPRAPAAL